MKPIERKASRQADRQAGVWRAQPLARLLSAQLSTSAASHSTDTSCTTCLCCPCPCCSCI